MSIRNLPFLGLLVLAQGCFSGSDSVPQQTSSNGGAGGAQGTGGSAGKGGSNGNGGTSHPGTGGNGGSNGSAGAGGTADPCANTIFCDDFESYTAGSAPGGKWSNNQNGGSLAVDTGKAHSGHNAVKVTAASSGGYRSVMLSMRDASVLPIASGKSLYGRMMFFLESSPTATVHWTFIAGSGKVPGQSYDAIYRYGGQLPIKDANGMFLGSQLMANYDTPDSYQTPPVGPSSDCWLHSDKKLVPTGHWACAEWEFDTTSNSMHFWLEGDPVPDLTMAGTGQGCVHQDASFAWLAPEFTSVDLGWESYQADDARTMWIDDVALGTQRLHCPPP